MEGRWILLEKIPFTILGYGAGTGALCQDILNYLITRRAPSDQLNYGIIEKSQTRKQQERKLLNEKGNGYNSLNEIDEINGCIISNKGLDNFPVPKVTMKDELMEVFVDYKDELVEVLKPAKKDVKNYLWEHSIVFTKRLLYRNKSAGNRMDKKKGR